MQSVVMYLGHNAPHQHYWGTALADGFARHGIRVAWADSWSPQGADLAVFWGVRRVDTMAWHKARGERVLVLERGYLGDRTEWASVSFGGGLNGRGRYVFPAAGDRRFDRHFADQVRPWRRGGDGYALILGQVPNDMSLAGVAVEGVYTEAAGQLVELGFDVVYRPHPVGAYPPPPGARVSTGTLAEDLAGAAVAVTISSNAGVDALLAGVPVVVFDDRAMSWPVSAHEISDTVADQVVERAPWLDRLAWCQWQAHELASGQYWEIARDATPERL